LATFGDLAGVAAFLADFGDFGEALADFGEAFGDFTGVLDLTGDFFGVAIASSARSLWSLPSKSLGLHQEVTLHATERP
jgi:hypothetical protein